jgi:protein-tyrosine phosphatase
LNKILKLMLLVLFLIFLVSSVNAQPRLENFRWVGNTGLALSGQPSSSDWKTLAGWGIKATVNLCCIPDAGSDMQDNQTYLNSLGIEYYWLPVTDDIDVAWNITEEQADDAIDWINQKLGEGKSVLIHCSWGEGRSVTLGMMWYVHEGHTPNEAFVWIEQFPEAYPVGIQKQAVRNYYNWLQPNQATEAGESYFIIPLVAITVMAVLLYWKLKKRD